MLCGSFLCILIYLFERRCVCMIIFFCKQKTAYEVRISDWSSDVCSSDLSGSRSLLPAVIVPLVSDGELTKSSKSSCPTSRSTCSRSRSRGDAAQDTSRSEERRVGKELSVRVDLGGRRIITKKIQSLTYQPLTSHMNQTNNNK